MSRHSMRNLVVAISLLGTIVTACGRSSSPVAPAAQTSAPSVPAATAGATISGTVVGVITASRITAQRVSLSVMVTGTTLAATVDDSGRFTLTNVPAGRVDLHFVGTGVDAHLTLDGIADHATVVITVRVNGNDAHLEDDHGAPTAPGAGQAQAEVEGAINAGSLSGSCTAHTLSFLIGTTKIVTNASTVFRDGTCAGLKSGSRVEVKGTRQPDGSVVAASVESEDEDDEDDDGEDQGEVRLNGTIATGSLAGSCAAASLSFRVSSTAVKTNSATRFKDTPCASLKAGDSVEVRGARQSDQSVLASRVERKR